MIEEYSVTQWALIIQTMQPKADSLLSVYEGWGGYQKGLVHAVVGLTAEQLTWRPSGQNRSAGELLRHIALGRLNWFLRMDAPGSRELAGQIEEWQVDADGNRHVVEEAIAITELSDELIRWLEASWSMVDRTLRAWTMEDLKRTYRHRFRGTTYAVSHQWTIWRIMAHDIHHGGQLTILLRMQGIEPFELGELGGHIIEPPRAVY